MNFGQAVEELKLGNKITRKCWDRSNTKVLIAMQLPDENSFMTQPYMYMELDGRIRSPLELTQEIVLGEDYYSLTDEIDEDISKMQVTDEGLKLCPSEDSPNYPEELKIESNDECRENTPVTVVEDEPCGAGEL